MSNMFRNKGWIFQLSFHSHHQSFQFFKRPGPKAGPIHGIDVSVCLSVCLCVCDLVQIYSIPLNRELRDWGFGDLGKWGIGGLGDQRIVIFPTNRNRNRFTDPTSVQIGIGRVGEFQNLQI